MRGGWLMTVAATALASLALGACGSDKGLIPASSAGTMDAALQRVADATNAGDCAAATSALDAAQKAYDALPSSVDARLRSLLLRGLEKLTQTVPAQCAQDGGATGPAGTVGTTGPQETLPTETTTTETTPPPTTDTTAPTETTPTDTGTTPDTGGVSPDQGNGQGPDGTGPPGQNKKAPPGPEGDGG